MIWFLVGIYWLGILITTVAIVSSTNYREGRIAGVPLSPAQAEDRSVVALIAQTKLKVKILGLVFVMISLLLFIPSLEKLLPLIFLFLILSLMGVMVWTQQLFHDTLWNIVVERGWQMEREHIRVSIPVARERGKAAVSVVWHIIALLISFIPLVLRFVDSEAYESFPWFALLMFPLIQILLLLARRSMFGGAGIQPTGDDEKDIEYQHFLDRSNSRLAAVLALLISVYSTTMFIGTAVLYADIAQVALMVVFIGGVLGLFAVETLRKRAAQKRIYGEIHVRSQPVVNGPQYYRYGFYNNPDDPRTLVPKQYGGGWTLNLAKKGGKIAMIATFVLVGVVLIGVVWLTLVGEMGTYDVEVANAGTPQATLTISAPLYSDEIHRDKIEDMRYLDALPRANRTNGYGGSTKLFGEFNVQEYGSSMVFVYEDAPVIAIKENGNWTFFGGEDHAQTGKIYGALQRFRATGVWEVPADN